MSDGGGASGGVIPVRGECGVPVWFHPDERILRPGPIARHAGDDACPLCFGACAGFPGQIDEDFNANDA